MAKLLATDETLMKVSANLETIAAHIGVLAATDLETMVKDPYTLHKLIQSGLAEKVLSVGDQIIVPHSYYGEKAYDIIGFDHDPDATGLYDHSITIQSHEVIDLLVFDAREMEVATEETFSADYSYYTATSDADVYQYLTPGTDYTVGAAIPTGTTYYHSAIEDHTGYICRYGYNNWEHSALRQFLNSEATAGNWWTAQHLGDVAPSYAATRDGFLYGLDEDFKKIIGTTKKVTALNTITDGGGSVELTEKIFLLSRTEVSGGNENGIAEGKVYEYYNRLVGSVTTSANAGRIKYYKDAAHWWGLRDPNAGYSYGVRNCTSDGLVSGSYGASYSDRGLSPACILV